MQATMKIQKKRKSFALIGLFVIVLTMTATVLAIMFFNRIGMDTLDLRQQAMVEGGSAELNTYPFDQSTLKVAEKQNIQLQVNTGTKSVDAIELQLEITADTGMLDQSQIQFEGSLPDTLQVDQQVIQKNSCEKDCYTALITLTTKDPAVPYSSHDQYETLQSFTFKPLKEGSLQIQISQDSQIIENGTNSDILNQPSVLAFEYYITENGIDPAQCYFAYSDWGSCQNNIQTRSFTVEPNNCQWYESETLQELSRACVSSDSNIISANSAYFYLYTPDACWYAANDGSNVYILWNKVQYSDIDWVDVSTSSDFGSFYHKQVSGNIDQTSGDFLIMTASNFRSGNTNEDKVLAFEPDQQYFFRLHKSDGRYVASARLYMTYCSGAEKLYRSCNEVCGSASDDPNKACASGLTCSSENRCRRVNNLEDSRCLPTRSSTSTIPSTRSCNDYCSDSSECSSGLSCFWNRCRLASNLQSSSCQSITSASTLTSSVSRSSTQSSSVVYQTKTIKNAILPSEASQLSTYACNHGCETNRDCQSNLRCYKGSCRLASDPENASCGSSGSSSSATSSASTSSSSSAGLSGRITTNSEDFASVTPTPTVSSPSLLQTILNNFHWQYLALAGVFLIAALGLIVSSVSRGKKELWQQKEFTVPAQSAAKPSGTPVSPNIPTQQPVKIQTLNPPENNHSPAMPQPSGLPTAGVKTAFASPQSPQAGTGNTADKKFGE